MVDPASDVHSPVAVGPAAPPRRAHTYSRFTTAIAVLALATAIYALWRLDATRDRLDTALVETLELEADRNLLRAEVKNLAARERQATRDVERRLAILDEVPRQVRDLTDSVEELRGRAEGPQRAYARAEALFLLELAQRRLTLDRDVDTAIVALESADSRLASLRDASFAPVRQQLARDLQALRAVSQPDSTGILARLRSAEELALKAPVKGIVAIERRPLHDAAMPEGTFARALSVLRNATYGLVAVRKVDDRAGSIVTAEEALLRRQHLQLLLFSARTALARHDNDAYRAALATARVTLDEFFDLGAPSVRSLLETIQALEPINIDPALPDIGSAERSLRRLLPAARGPE